MISASEYIDFMTSPEFDKTLIKKYCLVTVRVLYYLPDYAHLLNELWWQATDLPPSYPRIKRFIDYWEHEIDARIKEVNLECNDMPPSFRKANAFFKL